MLGGLTKYQKINSLAPESNGNFVIQHNLGIDPKFILVSPAEGVTITAGKFKDYGVAGNFGGAGYIGASTGTYTYSNASHRVETTGSYNSCFSITNTTVILRQQSGSLGWDINGTYQVELWG